MRDEFKLNIDEDLFRKTNSEWNSLMLNNPWSVGYVTTLIETKQWKSKEEWEQYYYASGAERRKSAATDITLLEDFQLVLCDKSKIDQMSWSLKNLNFQYGRTEQDLKARAEVLCRVLNAKGIKISNEECFECVRFRTICETWNGVIIREENTIKQLQQLLGSNVEFKKTEGEIDYTFAVDYEVYVDNTLKFGIQVKPKSYFGNAPYLRKAQHANEQKFLAYQCKYGVPVYVVTSKTSGEIQNPDIITTMQKALF